MWFLIAIIFVTTLILPVWFLIDLSRKKKSKLVWFTAFLFTVSYMTYFYTAGRWDWVGYYFRYALIALGIYALIRAFQRNREAPIWPERSLKGWIPPVFNLLLSALFIMLGTYALTGSQTSDQAVDLRFPLRDGTYYVAHGGSQTIVNYHHEYLPQQYALDIGKLFASGWRAKGIYPSEVEKYAIFGDTLYSPCNGKVLLTADGFEDVPAAELGKLPEGVPAAGNHVVIGCLDTEVTIAHMQKGSIKVKQGDNVDINMPIGLVGNSGNTSEPHLHIHAERGGIGVPITFNGRFLTRNQLVRE